LVSVKVKPTVGGEDWWLTVVYGLANDADKPSFLAELHELRQIRTGLWLLAGDFNMIYTAEDKNNGRVNRRRMGAILVIPR
jgi:hypothetical protein